MFFYYFIKKIANSKGPLNLTPLEVAVLSNSRLITRYLLQNGASESTNCKYLI